MKTSPRSSLGHFKLLLFNFILIQSTCHAIATTPKPRSSFASLETLPLPATNSSKIINNIRVSESSPIKADLEESTEIMNEDDLDSSATSQNNNILLRKSDRIEEQMAAPSTTTVHQVWASSSSDSLDELTPEVISKLRNDVPFLAAYSIRPRLVGGISKNFYGNQQSGALVSQAGYTTQVQAPSTAASDVVASRTRSNGGLSSQTSATSSPQNPLSKLGIFNEFKVETSSTSKSEHHHKRKTVLKRREDDQQPAELRSKRRQILSTASQLMAKRRSKSKRNNRNQTKQHNSVVGGKGRSTKRKSTRDLQKSGRLIKRAKNAAQRNQAKTGRLRRRLNGRNLQYHMNAIKHGRYLQEQPVEASGPNDKLPLNPTKGGSNDGGVKGGSAGGNRRTPFYAKAQPRLNENESSDEDISGNGLIGGNGLAKNGVDEGEKPILGERREEGEGAEGEADEGSAAPLPEPKRVGDEDVEEEGDTVTVVPKYDGVDDDPEPVDDADADADADADRSTNGEREEPPREGKETADGGSKSEGKNDNGEPRTRRVNRERPNQTDDKPAMNGNGIGLGGGLGATIGGGGGSGNGSPNSSDDGTDSSESDKSDYDNKNRMRQDTESKPTNDDREPSGIDTSNGISPMNERGSTGGADDVSDADEDIISDERKPENDIERLGGPKPDEGNSDRNQSGATGSEDETDRAKGRQDSPSGGGTTISGAKSDEEDLDTDYRDEMAAEGERKRKRPQHDDNNSKGENSTRKDREDCNDNHKQHHDHGDEHDHHHDHHDTIKWLQDAIPGEPGEDYPILSKVNLTTFNCRDQKYPGYYADVSSRCQVSRISDCLL